MLNEIIKGIAVKLGSSFGDGYKVYANDIKQGLEEPCFFIRLVTSGLTSLANKRYIKSNAFDIIYYPEESGSNSEMIAVGERLSDVLDYITLQNGDRLKASLVSYEIQNGTLHCFVNYNHTLTEERNPLPTMDELEIDSNTTRG